MSLKNYYVIMCGADPLPQAADAVTGSNGKDRPDSKWLAPRPKGLDAATLSLWTGLGLKRYVESGLLQWQIDRVKADVEAWVLFSAIKVYEQNEHQVFCPPDQLKVIRKLPVPELLKALGL